MALVPPLALFPCFVGRSPAAPCFSPFPLVVPVCRAAVLRCCFLFASPSLPLFPFPSSGSRFFALLSLSLPLPLVRSSFASGLVWSGLRWFVCVLPFLLPVLVASVFVSVGSCVFALSCLVLLSCSCPSSPLPSTCVCRAGGGRDLRCCSNYKVRARVEKGAPVRPIPRLRSGIARVRTSRRLPSAQRSGYRSGARSGTLALVPIV